MALKYIDSEEIRRTINLLKPDNELFEVRIISNEGAIKSGYFRGADKLIEELLKQDLRGSNVYFTLQRLHEGCEARIQWEHFITPGKLPTTSDKNIIGYSYIPVDIDPVRPAGISSTDEELRASEDVRAEVAAYMESNGFRECVKACSGNGLHLLYRAPRDWTVEEGNDSVKSLLLRMDELFGNSLAHVDRTNFNPARIFKLYGTLAQKGRNTEKRPHRMAHIEETVNWYV